MSTNENLQRSRPCKKTVLVEKRKMDTRNHENPK